MGHTGTGPHGSSNDEWRGGGDAGWRVEMLAKDEQVASLTARLAAAEALLLRWHSEADTGRLDGVSLTLMCETDDYVLAPLAAQRCNTARDNGTQKGS